MGVLNKNNNGVCTIWTYGNEYKDFEVGDWCGGEGYSGLTDGVDVRGFITKIDVGFDSVTIWSDKLDMPCDIKLRSLYHID